MASGVKLSLIPQTTHAAATTTTGASNNVELHHKELILVSQIASFTAGSFTVTLQHSPDGVTWLDLVSCDAQTANGMKIKEVSGFNFHFVRAVAVSTGGSVGGKVTVDLYYNTTR